MIRAKATTGIGNRSIDDLIFLVLTPPPQPRTRYSPCLPPLLSHHTPAMATHRDARLPSTLYIDPAPAPTSQPKVEEIGTTSAPLKSAAFFIGGGDCKKYNEDFMLCKAESRDPEHCLKEGRRVTRCAQEM